MNAVREFGLQKLVDATMSRDARHACERRGDDPHNKMRFAAILDAAGMVQMTCMAIGIVDHLEKLR